MRRRLCEIAVLVTGILILAGGFAHSLIGWPAVSGLLTQAAVDPLLLGGLFMEWNFSGGAMLVLGALVILLYRDMRASTHANLRSGQLVGALYGLFGAAGYIYRFPNAHFLAFLAIGVTLTGALLLWPRERSGGG